MRRWAVLLAAALLPAAARAQTRPQDMPQDLWHAFKEQAAPEGLVEAGTTAALFAFARPQDKEVREAVIALPPPVKTNLVHDGDWVGSAGVLFGAMGATYGTGWAAGSPKTQEAGAMGLEALALAGIEGTALKVSARRRRPDGADLHSFPSGHATESFAVATTLASQFGWWAGVPAYLTAGFIGYSRLQMDKHWLSDVVAGAGLGVLAGRAVWRVHHRQEKRVVIVPWAAPGGLGVVASARF